MSQWSHYYDNFKYLQDVVNIYSTEKQFKLYQMDKIFPVSV